MNDYMKSIVSDIICTSCKNPVYSQDNAIICKSCHKIFPFWKDTLLMSANHDFYYSHGEELSQDTMIKFIGLCEKQSIVKTVNSERELLTDFLIEYSFSNKRALFKLLLEPSQNKVALDLGCGLGIVSLNLASCFRKIYAVDLTKERAEFTYMRAKQNGFDNVIPLCAGDEKLLPFKDDFFDCIVLNGVIEWVAEDKEGDVYDIQKRFLVEISRILKGNGVLYIGIENRYGYNYLKGWAEEHTGIRFLSLLPRYIATKYSIFARNKPYRNYTYSWGGYQRLLKEACFSKLKRYLPANNYRFINGFIDPDNKVWAYNYFRKTSANFVKALIKRKISKIMHPSFSITAKKEGQLNPWLIECCQGICNSNYNNKSFNISNLFVTSFTDTCIVELEIKDDSSKKSLIIKIPLNKISEKKCHAESIILKRMHVVPIYSDFIQYSPRFIEERELHGIKYFVQEKIPGRALLNNSLRLEHKRKVIQFIIKMHKHTKHNNSSELFQLSYCQLSDIFGFIDPDQKKNVEHLIELGKRLDEEYNNVRVFSHGDMWEENILWDNKGQLKGIIDWCDAQISGLPLLDLIHFLYLKKVLTLGVGFGDFCLEFVLDKVPITKYEQDFLRIYCKEIYGEFSDRLIKQHVFLYSLYHILWRIPYYTEINFDKKWIDDNICLLVNAAGYVSSI